MEMMPYHTDGGGIAADQMPFDASSAQLPRPAGGRPTGDWTAGLPVLGDGTFTLRELTLADAPSLFAHLTTEEVARFISPPPTSVEGFEAFIQWTHLRRSQGRYACFGIVPAGQAHAVGMFQVKVLDAADGVAEWGFVLGQAYWGTGLFLKGARAVVDFVFTAMGIQRLEARSVLQNGRGNGALRKVGALRVEVLPRSFERHGVHLDQALWVLEPEAWWAGLADRGGTVH